MSNGQWRVERFRYRSVERRVRAGIVVATLTIAGTIGDAHAQFVIGACCLPNGTCTVTLDISCAVSNGIFQGNGTTCAGRSCVGACCTPTEGCAVVSRQSCTSSAGEFKGFGSTCDECPAPLPAVFTYQGQLKQDGRPLDDLMDMRFSLWLAATEDDAADQIGSAQLITSIEVVNGLFSVELDFGVNAFDGTARWLQIEVHDPNDPPGSFTLLSPRQSLTPTPYALQTRGIVVLEDGNVGIGTKTPTSKLEVIGQNGLAITGPEPFLTLRDTTAGGARGIIATDAGDLDFYPHSFIGGSPLLTLRSFEANVGIGTTAPLGGLHVNKEPLGGRGTLSLEGTTHTYIGFYPQGAGAGRKAWLGFGGAGTNDVSLANEAGGNINLITTGDVVITAALDIGYEIASFRDPSNRFAGAACPTGKRVIGGGCVCVPNEVMNSRPFDDGSGWFCQCNGDDVEAKAICVNIR